MRTAGTIATTSSLALVAILVGGAVLAQNDDVMAPLEPEAATSSAVTVADAWSRSTPTEEHVGVAYMRLVNGTDTDDALIGASSPAAAAVELYQTSAADEGMMSMSPVASIPVPAGGEALLEPGGYHLLFVDLVEPLVEGDVIELSLELETAGALPVSVQVLGLDATGPAGTTGSGDVVATPPAAELPTRFTVEAYDSYFQPRVIEAPASTEIKVTLNNYGVLPHNIAFYWEEGGKLLSESALSAVIVEEQSATVTFTTPGPGVYFFLCVVHPLEMQGTLIVR